MDPTLRGYLRRREGDRILVSGGRMSQRGGGPLSFVIQKHGADQQHYDLRLEVGGVRKSWALPQGPSVDPMQRRLAVMVEDQPLSCLNFEGGVPDDRYGSGDAILWDVGVYAPDGVCLSLFEDRGEAERLVRSGLEAGKLSLFFWGYKLSGAWLLVRVQGGQGEWLLIKHDDLFAEPGRDLSKEDRSVITLRTLEELRGLGTAAIRGRRRA